MSREASSPLNPQGIGMTSQRTRERLATRLRGKGIANEAVLDAVRTVPRHCFVDEALAQRAYEDSALPIGYSQTISQPWVVARMTELLLESGPLGRVLEVGTGSGYQTAILARLAGQVYTVERIKPLLEKARRRLRALGLRNIALRHADGGTGWAEEAPFDAIMVTAAPERVPPELKRQLAEGGRLVIPAGSDVQFINLIRRRKGGGFDIDNFEAVRFVPLLPGLEE